MDREVFINACRQGGPQIESALRELQRHYGGALLREGVLAVRDHDTALDLVQATLIKVWRHCGSFRGDSELFPWLKQILRRSAIDWLRQKHPEQPLTDDDGRPLPEVEASLQAARGTPPATPETEASQQQLEAVYRRCAERFAREHPQAAAVIRWVAEDELDMSHIAALLQRSPAATREFVSQCRKKARVYFRDWHDLASPTGKGVR